MRAITILLGLLFSAVAIAEGSVPPVHIIALDGHVLTAEQSAQVERIADSCVKQVDAALKPPSGSGAAFAVANNNQYASAGYGYYSIQVAYATCVRYFLHDMEKFPQVRVEIPSATPAK